MQFQSLTSKEMQEFESYSCENYKVTVKKMMQDAGKAIFDVVMDQIKPSCILVVVGRGNNGGDALVAARLLYKSGAVVTVMVPYSDEEFSEAALIALVLAAGFSILRRRNRY